jgi:predicted secreted protein
MELFLDTNLIVRQSSVRTDHVCDWRWTVTIICRMDMKGRRSLAILALSWLLILLPAAESKSQAEEKSVKANKEFTISLDSNRTTGYKWEASFDRAFLRLKADRYKRPAKALVGAGGTQIFVFVPVKQGETKIRFVYKRPWEKSIAKEKTFTIHINR